VPADVVESADSAVVATQDEDGFPEKFEGVIVAGLRDVVDVTDDLPGRPEHALRFVCEELLVAIEPRGQADELVRIVAFGSEEVPLRLQGLVHDDRSITT
jgi:hypothetical protein